MTSRADRAVSGSRFPRIERSSSSKSWKDFRRKTTTSKTTPNYQLHTTNTQPIQARYEFPGHSLHVAFVRTVRGASYRSFLEWNRQQNVRAAHHRKHEARHRHRSRSKHDEEPSEIDRMANQ